jgi:hypothetical protein
MGGKSSSESNITNEVNTLINNQTTINHLTETSNEVVTNTTMEQAKSCEASVLMGQTVLIENVRAHGDIVIGEVNQTQDAMVTLTCVQSSDIKKAATANIASAVMAEIESKDKTDVLSQIENELSQTSATSGDSMGGQASTSSNVNNITNTEINTSTNINLTNILRNRVENNLKTDDIQQCISKLSNSQDIRYRNIESTAGSVTFKAMSQSQVAKSMTDCIQESKSLETALTEFANDVTSVVKKSSETSATSETKSKVTQSATASGLFSPMLLMIVAAIIVLMMVMG